MVGVILHKTTVSRSIINCGLFEMGMRIGFDLGESRRKVVAPSLRSISSITGSSGDASVLVDRSE